MNHANSPNISVIVPFVPPFDEDLLDLTLFSLSGQNSVSLEIILQVSGSERQSVIATDIVGRQLFNKGLVRSLVIQQIQAYGMASWAQTWDSARGDYLCILEPQSVLYPNALSILVSEIEKSSFGYAVGGSKRSLFKRNGRLEPVHV
ncbi:MAG: glycosyltransferase family 2 protein, partial [Proteobacteria bacterium]|nr:glycosyltransferase family 2 protein [Pseudomonadota bacterium]